MHLFIIIFAKTTHCVLMLVVTKGFMSPPRVIMSALKCIWNSIVYVEIEQPLLHPFGGIFLSKLSRPSADP